MKYLQCLLLTFCCYFVSYPIMQAQSAVTESISFELEDVSELVMPPDLHMAIRFVDDNGNEILEATEDADLMLTISNRGGTAEGLKVSVIPKKDYPGIILEQSIFSLDVYEDDITELTVPIHADIDVETGIAEIDITVSEPYGYDIHAVLKLSTFAYQKAEMVINGVSVVDAGKGLKADKGNPDGQLQRGEVVRATVVVQNIGSGIADDIEYSIVSKDKNVFLMTESALVKKITGNFDRLLVGETKEISFRLSANNNYSGEEEFLPIFLTMKEKMGFGDITEEVIPLPLDAVPLKPQIIKVEADFGKLVADNKTKIVSEDSRISSVKDIRNIMIAPIGEKIHNDAIAVVIGTEEYDDPTIPNAPYAEHDALVMTEYFSKSMGVDDVRVLTNNQVTSMELNMMFDATRGKLLKRVRPGQTDVFVYYSGHGVPIERDDGSRDIYLIPYDVGKSWIDDYGFSLSYLYSSLNSLNARSVTVFIDACFSGGTRPSDANQSRSISNQKLVIHDIAEINRPWLDNPDFRVFTSSKGNQTSFGSDRSQSGLFTYFVAVGLQGDADENNDGTIRLDELVEYVTSMVDKESGGAQTPQFYGNTEFVVEKFR